MQAALARRSRLLMSSQAKSTRGSWSFSSIKITERLTPPSFSLLSSGLSSTRPPSLAVSISEAVKIYFGQQNKQTAAITRCASSPCRVCIYTVGVYSFFHEGSPYFLPHLTSIFGIISILS